MSQSLRLGDFDEKLPVQMANRVFFRLDGFLGEKLAQNYRQVSPPSERSLRMIRQSEEQGEIERPRLYLLQNKGVILLYHP